MKKIKFLGIQQKAPWAIFYWERLKKKKKFLGDVMKLDEKWPVEQNGKCVA